MYRPQQPFNVPAKILIPTTIKVNGINQKTYSEWDDFFCSAKSYGGTEKTVNGVFAVEDTMEIECWYRPDITSGCHIKLLDDNSEWEIVTPPENIERRNQFLKFKIRRLSGGA